MPIQARPPPPPGPIVQPNFLSVMEGVGSVTFPISKRELVEHVGDRTVLYEGRNVALHDIIKDIPDDFFESEDELLDALESTYVPAGDQAEDEAAADVKRREHNEPWTELGERQGVPGPAPRVAEDE